MTRHRVTDALTAAWVLTAAAAFAAWCYVPTAAPALALASVVLAVVIVHRDRNHLGDK